MFLSSLLHSCQDTCKYYRITKIAKNTKIAKITKITKITKIAKIKEEHDQIVLDPI